MRANRMKPHGSASLKNARSVPDRSGPAQPKIAAVVTRGRSACRNEAIDATHAQLIAKLCRHPRIGQGASAQTEKALPASRADRLYLKPETTEQFRILRLQLRPASPHQIGCWHRAELHLCIPDGLRWNTQRLRLLARLCLETGLDSAALPLPRNRDDDRLSRHGWRRGPHDRRLRLARLRKATARTFGTARQRRFAARNGEEDKPLSEILFCQGGGWCRHDRGVNLCIR